MYEPMAFFFEVITVFELKTEGCKPKETLGTSS